MCIIMIPLATTELGTDGAITGLMEEPLKAAGQHPLLVLIYTSAIMMILRFWFAGPIVAKLGPLGLLATSAVLAIAGLYLLSTASGLFAVFACATLYGFGKTFFWPTTLGVVSEQCPKGGALTLNAIAGIGMLAVGILGGPVIGKMTEDSIKASVEEATSVETYESISNDSTYFLGAYTAIDAEKVGKLPEENKVKVEEGIQNGKQGSLASVAIFPFFMLACYIALILYFKNKGGYKPVEL
jgi:MFS family permease